MSLQTATFDVSCISGCGEQRMVLRMADALCSAYSIPPGSNLVPLLGDGNEPNNQAAVTTWVSNALLNLDEKTASHLLPLLVARLGEVLQQQEKNQW